MHKLSETKYNQALDAYNRLKEVYDKGSLVEIKWVEMESNLHQAEAALAISKNNLEKTMLTAPENGIIGKRNIEPGMSSVGISAPFELVKIGRIYVRLSVPENEIAKVKQGLKATFSVPAIGTNLFSGEVTMVGVVADRFARTYEVKILADNPELIIKPGMICDISLNCDQAPVNVVDYRAVTHDVNGAFVYKVNPSKTAVTKQPIQTGQTTPDGIEILAGLQPGDEVVCVGLNKISDNSKIEL
jgi:RND family efflux transporter MFP subunit